MTCPAPERHKAWSQGQPRFLRTATEQPPGLPEPHAFPDLSQPLGAMKDQQAAASRIFPTWTPASATAQMISHIQSAILPPILHFLSKRLCPLQKHN